MNVSIALSVILKPSLEVFHSRMLSAIELERRRWLRRNPRILSRIGEQTDYKRTMVSLVFNGHRKSDGTIEEALRDAGAPGFSGKKQVKKA